MPVDKAVETVKKNRDALAYVRGTYQGRTKFISDAQDEITSHERGYGDAARPEEYLKEFHDFIDHNINDFANGLLKRIITYFGNWHLYKNT